MTSGGYLTETTQIWGQVEITLSHTLVLWIMNFQNVGLWGEGVTGVWGGFDYKFELNDENYFIILVLFDKTSFDGPHTIFI